MSGSGPPQSPDVPPPKPGDTARVIVSLEIAAEAAVWIARLHGPDRSPTMERECLAWQSRSAAHRHAFERSTEVWQAVPRVTLADAYASVSEGAPRLPPRVRPRRGHLSWAAVLLVTLAVGVAFHTERPMPDYVTAIGEQRSVVLEDGSRLSLNTSTQVQVRLTPARRVVQVRSGEALFEVAKDPKRPFVVQAAGSEIVAKGTTFAVRLTPQGAATDPALAVTLLEGRVSVRPGEPRARQSGGDVPPELQLSAGERLTVAAGASLAQRSTVVTRDHPRLEQVTAWKRSEVVFDNVSLSEAVGEMNRYNREPIVLGDDPSLTRLRVSGAFRAGDSDGFARAAATLHGLVMQRHDGHFELLNPH